MLHDKFEFNYCYEGIVINDVDHKRRKCDGILTDIDNDDIELN